MKEWSQDEIDDAMLAMGGPDLASTRRTLSWRSFIGSGVIALASGTQGANMMSKAIEDVLDERIRQVAAEGWTPEHDDEHQDGELARAAVCYVEHATFEASIGNYDLRPPPGGWPWDQEWWKPKNPRRDLVRAAALLIAEIERLDRSDGYPPSGDKALNSKEVR